MRLFTVVTSVLAVASLAVMARELIHVLEIGTCASGGPYVSARQCPDGTGTTILLLAGSIVVYTLATIMASMSSFSWGMLWFGLLFTVLGATFIAAEATDHVNGGGGVGWILGGVFLPMGLFPLIAGIKGVIEDANDAKRPAPVLVPYAAYMANGHAQPPVQVTPPQAQPPSGPSPFGGA